MNAALLVFAWSLGALVGWWAHRRWGLYRVRCHFEALQARFRARELEEKWPTGDRNSASNGWSND